MIEKGKRNVWMWYCSPGGNIIRNIRETCRHVAGAAGQSKNREHGGSGEASEMFHYVFVATTSRRRCKITRGAHLFPPHPPVAYLSARTVTRSGQFYSGRDTRRHGPLPSCYLPEATRKKVTGERRVGRETRRWIKNEDKSVPGIAGPGVARRAETPESSAEERVASLEQ